MKKLRCVLVGCGGMSAAWFEAAANRDDVETVGLVDISEAAALKRKTDYGLSDAVTSTNLNETLDRLQPDILYNCTIPEAHFDTTIVGLNHGCHVLSEKPLADSMVHAAEMVRTARKVNRIFSVIQNRRYNPQMRAFRDFLDSHEIGKLTTLNSDFYLGIHFGGFRDHMEHVLLLDMAIHSFDQARLISGADPVAVYCKEWNPSGSWYDHDASAIAIFEMSNGIVYTYRGSWCAEGVNTSWECDWRAVGEIGTVTWDGSNTFRAQKVTGYQNNRAAMADIPVPVSQDVKQGGHKGCINEFLESVKNGGRPETSGEDNIKSLAMVFGAIESSQTGQRVQITLPSLV